MTGRREVALEHLTLLDVAPPDLVSLAAAAGFGAVSLRVSPPPTGSSPGRSARGRGCWPTRSGGWTTPASGCSAPRPSGWRDSRSVWEPVLATAAQLGARYLNAISEDRNLTRLTDRFAELTQLALPYGVRPVIEFMSYKPVHTLAAALNIAATLRRRAGAGGRAARAALRGQPGRPGRRRPGPAQLRAAVRRAARAAYRAAAAAALPGGQPVSGGDLALEARARRLLPGQGELPLGRTARRAAQHHPGGRGSPVPAAQPGAGRPAVRGPARAAADRVLALAAAPAAARPAATASPGQQTAHSNPERTRPMPARLAVRDLSKHYRGVVALRDVSLHVNRARWLAWWVTTGLASPRS